MTSGRARDSGEKPRASWRARRFRPPRRLRFTRSGKYYVGFTLLIGLAAINTGNNLLFLVLGLMLAGITLSGMLSEATLRGLEVKRVLPLEARAGRPVLVGLSVTNRKARLGSFAVVGRDVTESGEAGRVFALHLDGGQTRELAYRWEPARRGRVRFLRIELATRYPFGLFEKWREYFIEADLVVFPREVAPPALQPSRAQPPGERPSGAVGSGTEFFALREARFGDDARHIHWKTSARRGRPVVVERERERRRRVAVIVDNREGPGPARPHALDHLAERAAALVRQGLEEGCEVALSASGVMVPAGTGSAHERRILRELALLEPGLPEAPPARVAHAEQLSLALADAPATEEAA